MADEQGITNLGQLLSQLGSNSISSNKSIAEIFGNQNRTANSLPPPPQNFDNIASILANQPHDRYFSDQRIVLDGYVFTNCCFNNCEIVTLNGLFSLRSCVIMQNCRIIYGPQALRVVKLFNLQFWNLNLPYDVYKATQEANGSITIE